MIEIWVNPDNNRIMAIYEGCKSSTKVWENLGYKKWSSYQPFMKPLIQPTPPPEQFIEVTAKDGQTYKISKRLLIP